MKHNNVWSIHDSVIDSKVVQMVPFASKMAPDLASQFTWQYLDESSNDFFYWGALSDVTYNTYIT